ncbi:hypothetical protein IFM12276_00330 [Nocardia sputorum]|uniref:Uncharacterized protein n=1 Tax=Nocardia sputorum TaxID=2984338 RepID=A0ABN6TVQ5_9NOCA|nr:hypothetical protein IFM12276_00330 [Nocardia sputorum]
MLKQQNLFRSKEGKVTVASDRQGRPLAVGDPVTLVGGIANRGGQAGRQSHGEVDRFGPVNVHVRITDSSDESLIGNVVPVPGHHLSYGHSGYVRASDGIKAAMEEGRQSIEAAVSNRADEALRELIKTARERSIITPEQGRQLWALRKGMN